TLARRTLACRAAPGPPSRRDSAGEPVAADGRPGRAARDCADFAPPEPAALLAEVPPLAPAACLAVPEPPEPDRPEPPRAGLASEAVPPPDFRPDDAVPRLPDLPPACRVAIRCSR